MECAGGCEVDKFEVIGVVVVMFFGESLWRIGLNGAVVLVVV